MSIEHFSQLGPQGASQTDPSFSLSLTPALSLYMSLLGQVVQSYGGLLSSIDRHEVLPNLRSSPWMMQQKPSKPFVSSSKIFLPPIRPTPLLTIQHGIRRFRVSDVFIFVFQKLPLFDVQLNLYNIRLCVRFALDARWCTCNFIQFSLFAKCVESLVFV